MDFLSSFSIYLSPPLVVWHLTINIPIPSSVHRNMPKEQAMDFVQAEYNRGHTNEQLPRDPAAIAAQASELLDDFLDREKVTRYTVPSSIRHLLLLLAEGVHLYPEELVNISEYIHSREDHLQGETLTAQQQVLLALCCVIIVASYDLL